MRIYGAGLAGLLAANMLRRHKPIIHEAQPSLPNNHEALLRFRSSAVSDATGIPFKKVRVNKAIWYSGQHYTTPNLFFSNMYSQKVTGEVMGRSISNLDPVDRYIAPGDFIAQLASGCQIEYNSPLTDKVITEAREGRTPVISTIPLPRLLLMASDAKQELSFKSLPIWSVTADVRGLGVDVYQTIYYPGVEPMYRASITGSHLIVEFAQQPEDGTAARLREILQRHFGISGANNLQNIQTKQQTFGKILPISDAARKRAIIYLTDQHGIYSIGRFATWRQILMDDVVEDIKTVEGFITTTESAYARALHYRPDRDNGHGDFVP